jgi:hypothetical protein
MSEYHKELMSEIVDQWTIELLQKYIFELENRREQLDSWLKQLRLIRRKKVRKSPVDTGARDGR